MSYNFAYSATILIKIIMSFISKDNKMKQNLNVFSKILSFNIVRTLWFVVNSRFGPLMMCLASDDGTHNIIM